MPVSDIVLGLMSPDRWQRIEGLYHEAAARPPGERRAFLEQACPGDAKLRDEVISLLDHAPEEEATMTVPLAGRIKEGSTLGHYKVEQRLGAGGMGEVFRATDTRLNRGVAIKVSHGPFSLRFRREALVMSSLNHPHICMLFDVGPDYLVMELVEGETLQARLQRGALPLAETARLGAQIADALAEAHAKGITHRDLKPGNVMVTKKGVKLLDFGLAAVDGDSLTKPGAVMGTPAYMAPEQFKGSDAGPQTDIYALGLLLHEMASGRRPIIQPGEPAVLVKLPGPLQPIVERCLAEDADRRWRGAGEIRALLEVSGESRSTAAVRPAAQARSWLWPAVAALLLIAAAAGWWFYTPDTPKVEALRFEILENGQFKLENAAPSVSPDGRWVAFFAPGNDGKSHLWLRALDSLESRAIPGTETPNALPAPPFWSFDSKTIVFSNNTATSAFGQLMRVDVAGGTPQVICNIQASLTGATWSPDGVIVFSDAVTNYLQSVAATGGEPRPVTTLRSGDRSHRRPQFLPDGRRFLYYLSGTYSQTEGIYVGSLDVPAAEQSTQPVLRNNRQAYYSPAGGGQLLFLRDQTLFAQPFDPETTVLSGQITPVAEGVSSYAPAAVGRFSISTNGVLAYNAGSSTTANTIIRDLVSGKVLRSLKGQASTEEQAQFSADSKKVAQVIRDAASGNSNIWVTDLASGNTAQITYGKGRNGDPVWSPDGQYIAFASNRGGTTDLYVKKADGSGEERLILKTDREKLPTSWSRNGFLLFQSTLDGTGSDLWVLPHPESGNSQPVPYLQTKADELRGQFSPDGKWVAYASPESGQLEVYLRPFDPEHPAESAAGGRWLLSRGSGTLPLWTKGGRELLYISLGRLVAQEVDPAKPNEVRGAPVDVLAATGNLTVSPDGSKLLIDELPAADGPARLVVVKNWHAVLQK
jgi:eukaryotic-like serine/threonine-protein kinase